MVGRGGEQGAVRWAEHLSSAGRKRSGDQLHTCGPVVNMVELHP